MQETRNITESRSNRWHERKMAFHEPLEGQIRVLTIQLAPFSYRTLPSLIVKTIEHKHSSCEHDSWRSDRYEKKTIVSKNAMQSKEGEAYPRAGDAPVPMCQSACSKPLGIELYTASTLGTVHLLSFDMVSPTVIWDITTQIVLNLHCIRCVVVGLEGATTGVRRLFFWVHHNTVLRRN